MTRVAVRLECIRLEAEGICSFEFATANRIPFPEFPPGAHVDLHLPNGLARQYSLVERVGNSRFKVAVKRDAHSRGGSAFMHEQLRPGAWLEASEPRNNFPLEEDAAHSVLIAGGIGITPIVAMMRRLRELNRRFEVHYAVARRSQAAFLNDLAGPEFQLHVDAEQSGSLDLPALLAKAPADSHVYCCGPAPMLAAFEQAAEGRMSECVHLERFAPATRISAATTTATATGFNVQLARTGVQLKVPAGETILSILRAHGLSPQTSCEQGFCGSCETRVLAGVPDHRDSFFTEEEKVAHSASMLICCSGSKDNLLVLDI